MNIFSRAIIFIASLIFLDRITKYGALLYCFKRPCQLSSFCTIDVTFNRGVAFGMFHFDHPALFGIVTTLICLIIGGLVWYAYKRSLLGYPIGGELFVIAGSLSNLFDRFFYHGVIDFIELSYKNFTWYSFNIADACIVIGVILMLYFHWQEES